MDEKQCAEGQLTKLNQTLVMKKELQEEVDQLKKQLLDGKILAAEKVSTLKQTFLEHSEKIIDQNKKLLEEKRKVQEVSKKICITSKKELSEKVKEIKSLKDKLRQLLKNKDAVLHEVEDDREENYESEFEEEDVTEVNDKNEETNNEVTEDGQEDQVKVESFSVPNPVNSNNKLDSLDESIQILSSFIEDHKDETSKKVKEEPHSTEGLSLENAQDSAPEKREDRSSLLLEQIECVTNQYKSERAMLHFKEKIREICRESKQLFSAKNYECVEGKIVDHYSKAKLMEISDLQKQKITDLLVKLSKKYTQ